MNSRILSIDQLKEKLAQACRMLERAGLIDFSGHISGRIEGESRFFIHPMALSRAEVRARDFIEVDLEGRAADKEADIPHETAIHAAIYQARSDVNSVVHLHTKYSILPGISGRDLIPVCQYGSIFGRATPVYHDSEKITSLDRARSLAELLGRGRAAIMKGHGAVIAETSIERAFAASLYLERNAKVQVMASILGDPIPLSEDEIQRCVRACFSSSVIEKLWSYHLERAKRAGVL